jgi:hypothetical protein
VNCFRGGIDLTEVALVTRGREPSRPPYLDHDGDLAQFSHNLNRITPVDLVLKGSRKTTSVGNVTLSAFGRENLAVARHLVRRRNLGLLEVHIFDSDLEEVSTLDTGSIVAIEICLGANVGKTVVQQAGLAILTE